MPLTTQSAKTWLSTHYYWVVSGFLALAVSLRGITATPLSHDEFYSLNAVTEGIDEHLWEAPWIPYYAFLWVWTGAGNLTTDFWMRLASVLAIVGLAITVAVIAKNLLNRWAGLAAGLIVAVSPASQKFALQARVYALAAFLFTLALYFLIKAIAANQKKSWVLYSITMVIAGILAPFGLVVLIGHFIILITTNNHDPQTFKRWLISCIPLIILLLVGFGTIRMFSQFHGFAPTPNLTNLASGLEWLGTSGALPTAASGAFGFGVLILAAITKQSSKFLWAGLLGTAAVWLVSLGPMTFWSGQYLFTLMPFVAIGAALTLGTLSKTRTVGILALLAAIAYPSFIDLRTPLEREPNMRVAADFVADNQNLSTQILDNDELYGLGVALRHYRPDLTALTFTTEPEAPFWSIYGEPGCNSKVSLTLTSDVTLRLCN